MEDGMGRAEGPAGGAGSPKEASIGKGAGNSKESEAVEVERERRLAMQQPGYGDRCCCRCCCCLCKESGAVGRERLDVQQHGAENNGKESEAVEVERERLDKQQPEGAVVMRWKEDDEKRRARLTKQRVRSRAYYNRHKTDPEWKEARRAVMLAKTPPSQRRLPKSVDPQRASTLRQLLEAVLEEEPWDAARHGKNTGKAWWRCGERVPGYLDKCGCRPQAFVQITVLRMVRQLKSPRSIAARSWTPELRGRVEEVAAKLEADPRHRSKVYPPDRGARARGVRTLPAAGGRAEEPGLSEQQQEREREEPNGNVFSI